MEILSLLNPPLLAIDMGSSSIKICELSGKGVHKKLKKIGMELLPRGAIESGIIADADLVFNALKTLMQKLSIKPFFRRTSIGLGGSSVLIKKVRFPYFLNEVDLSTHILYEAEQHLGHNLDDLYFDFSIGSTDADKTFTEAILVGVKKEVADTYIDIIKRIGLKIGVIDANTLSILNLHAFSNTSQGQTELLVQLGAQTSTATLIYDNEFLYTREIELGGDHHTQAIASALNLDFENAWSLKHSLHSLEGNQQAMNAILRVHDQIASEIKVSSDYFFTQLELSEVPRTLSTIYLSGGAALTPKILDIFKEKFKTEVKLLSPFESIEVSPIQQSFLKNSYPAYFNCVGLAIRNFEKS